MSVHGVGELVLCTDGRVMVRAPERCGLGHPITPGRVLVGSVPCACDHGRHMTWLCGCGSTVYGPGQTGPAPANISITLVRLWHRVANNRTRSSSEIGRGSPIDLDGFCSLSIGLSSRNSNPLEPRKPAV
jgi:hypothetical protein